MLNTVGTVNNILTENKKRSLSVIDDISSEVNNPSQTTFLPQDIKRFSYLTINKTCISVRHKERYDTVLHVVYLLTS